MMRYVLFVCVLCVWCACGCAAGEVETVAAECTETDKSKCTGSGRAASGGGVEGHEGANQSGDSGTEDGDNKVSGSAPICEEIDKKKCKDPDDSKNDPSCSTKNPPNCRHAKVPGVGQPEAVTGGTCRDGKTAPCRDSDVVGPKNDLNTGNPQGSAGAQHCQPPKVLSADGKKCIDRGAGEAQEAQGNLKGLSDEAKRNEVSLTKAPGLGEGDEKKIIKGDETHYSNDSREGSPHDGQHQHQPPHDRITEKDQQGDVDNPLNSPKGGSNAKSSAPASGVPSPAVNTPEAESAVEDHPNGEPVESPAQAAVGQGDAVQSQTAPTSTSMSATEATGSSQPSSSSPSTDKGQDPKAADSSSGGASRRTGPLLL
ncbi:hypothetical protein DQ04_09281000, partial [Trypanosoma grayi]|uniref:hypothetical protein n=1 Tax=Trypanosoma grayi TaxID=71804 RepID=UPI0004F43DA5